MATRIRALGTFRNETRLPNGIVRRGQTVVVSDRYAEDLVDGGKAEIVERNVDLSEDTGEAEESDSEEVSGEPTPEQPESSDGAPKQPGEWKNEDLPEDAPKYDTLKGEDIHTLGDLKYFVDNDLLGDIDGIGPAYVDRITKFLNETVPQKGE